MEKKDVIRKFVNKYIFNIENESKRDVLTRYVSVDKDRVINNKEDIIKFFSDNFLISGVNITYQDLLFDELGNYWTRLDNKRDLELFEQLIAIGYEAGIFIDDMRVKFANFNKIGHDALKYTIPEEFEYIDEEYYEGLNKGIINQGILPVDQDIYYLNRVRTIDDKKLLEYWFLKNNIDAAKECDMFYYMLENDTEVLIDIATYMYLNNLGPICLLFDFNKNIDFGFYSKIEYLLKVWDKDSVDAFGKCRQEFLSMIESIYTKEEIMSKKKGL